jgi:hypothetical protein
MNLTELFAKNNGNIAVNQSAGVVTVKGAKETIEYALVETVKDEKGDDQVTIAPAFSYKTDKGKTTKTAITAAE